MGGPPPPLQGPLARRGVAAVALVLAGGVLLATDEPVLAAATLLLPALWGLSRVGAGSPALAIALAIQWVQVTAGLWWEALTGRTLEWAQAVDPRPFAWVGMGALLALAAGIRLGRGAVRAPGAEAAPPEALPVAGILAYFVLVFAGTLLRGLAWGQSGLTQVLLALLTARYVLLFLLVQDLAHRPLLLAPLLGLEVVGGLLTSFSSFKEPVLVALCALLALRGRRLPWSTAVGMAALGVLLVAMTVVWSSIKLDVRRRYGLSESAIGEWARLESVADYSRRWSRHARTDPGGVLDDYVDRVWAIGYPAMAMERVPRLMAHTDGRLMAGTLAHVFLPRLLFPDKPPVTNNSEYVRKYAGVWVAGTESETSVAFGYAAESYVDYGIPALFVPILLFGVVTGLFLRLLHRLPLAPRTIEAVAAVVLFFSLYQFEQSWVRLITSTVLLTLALGAAAVGARALRLGAGGA